MAALFSPAAPKTRLVFEKSSFLNENSSHKKAVGGKYFTHSATVVIPCDSRSGTLAKNIGGLEQQQMCHLAKHTPLHLLIDKPFIEAFVKRGQLYVLSHKRHIDTQNCVAIIPTGHLILHVTKDTYEQLGLEGKPSAFCGKKPSKYVVDVDLTQKSFEPGSKGYDRVMWCLKERLDLTFDLLFSWSPHDDAICASSVAQFLRNKGMVVSPVPLCVKTQWLNWAMVPVLDSSIIMETEKSCGREALWEWLGAVACGIDMSESSPDSYLSTLECPSPSTPCERCCVLTVTGFLTPAATAWLLDMVRREVEDEKPGVRWASLTLHGFQDSPVSMHSREHGFFLSGDSLHSFICFPNREYWLYSAYGEHDFVQ